MARISGETIALGLDGGFAAPRVELFHDSEALAASLPRAVRSACGELPCSSEAPALLVAGSPSLCLAAVITGAERSARGVLVRYRIVHRTRLPGDAAQRWLDAFFSGSSLRLEAPYHIVRLHGLQPGEPVRFVREHEVAVTGRLAFVGRGLALVPERDPDHQPAQIPGLEPRGTLPVRIGAFEGTIPSAWGHDPIRPGLPLRLEVPELAPAQPSYRLSLDATIALRGRVGEKIRAAGVVGGPCGRELRPAFVCAGEAGDLLFEDPEVGWGGILRSPFLTPEEAAAA